MSHENDCTQRRTSEGENCAQRSALDTENCAHRFTSKVEDGAQRFTPRVENGALTVKRTSEVGNCAQRHPPDEVGNCAQSHTFDTESCAQRNTTEVGTCAQSAKSAEVEKCAQRCAPEVDNCAQRYTSEVEDYAEVETCAQSYTSATVENCAQRYTSEVENGAHSAKSAKVETCAQIHTYQAEMCAQRCTPEMDICAQRCTSEVEKRAQRHPSDEVENCAQQCPESEGELFCAQHTFEAEDSAHKPLIDEETNCASEGNTFKPSKTRSALKRSRKSKARTRKTTFEIQERPEKKSGTEKSGMGPQECAIVCVFMLSFLALLFTVEFFSSTGDGGNGTTNITSPINGTVELPPSTAKTTTPKKEPETKELPNKAAAENEHKSSLTIFFITLVVGICILLVHLLIQTHFHYLPDSIAIVLLGALIGLCLKVFKFGNWKQEEALSPTVFFIVLLPPIIFESGYNLHKGNFFQNIGSILVFAVLGTVISAVVVGGGVYLLGQAQVVYPLTKIESFAFGSLISAVDPVATLAIFQALDVDPILYMLVFGESVLNDAVSIVLTTTVLELSKPDAAAGSAAFLYALWRFCVMFFASAAIGVVFGLVSAMLLKFVDLHKTPSLEFGLVLIFSYMPYALAEGIHQSGIMAILCCGIVMSHYTHFNLSPVTQITVQQTFRTMAFVCETCVFAYLGLAIFSFRVSVKPAFCIWSVVLILIGRAVNIFPLSFMLNFFREHKITRKNQFIMWFSGLRGAVAFALSLHLSLENNEKRYVLVTATLIIVLFTIMFLGGSTMPLLKFMNKYSATDRRRRRRKSHKDVTMSKTKEMSKIVDREYLSELTTEEELQSEIVDSEHLSELTTEEEFEVNFVKPHLKGFMKWDAKYLVPFFTRRFTQKEVKEGRSKVDSLTRKWYKEVRAAPSESEDEGDGVRGGGGGSLLQMEETSLMTPSTSHNNNGSL